MSNWTHINCCARGEFTEEKLEDILADKTNIFKDKESANDYIRRFCKNCRPVKVEIRVVGE